MRAQSCVLDISKRVGAYQGQRAGEYDYPQSGDQEPLILFPHMTRGGG